MSVLALIPARGGSKRLPGKNLILLGERPLIAWTIEAARDAGIFDRIVVSTDSDEIAAAAVRYGAEVPFLRPPELATDNAGTIDVVRHAVEECGASQVHLLQPTSPFRTGFDIQAADQLRRTTGRSVISVTETKPWLVSLADDGGIQLERGFDVRDRPVYAPNGAIYAFGAEALSDERAWWHNAVGYVMPQDRSLDIDTGVDFQMAVALATRFSGQ